MADKNKNENAQQERHTGYYEFRRARGNNHLQIRVSVEKYVLESRLKNNVTKDSKGREWVDLYCSETTRPTQYAAMDAHNAIAPLRNASVPMIPAQQTFVNSAQQIPAQQIPAQPSPEEVARAKQILGIQ